MKTETRILYGNFISAIAEEIAEEQHDCNNLDYELPILKEYYYFFNTDFFENEIISVVRARIIDMGKSKRVGKFDKEAPRSYRRFIKSREKLF